MSKLQTLRFRLASLRGHRFRVRWATGLCVPLIGVVWLLLAIFGIDVIFEMTRLQRGVTFFVAIVVLIWIYVRYSHALLCIRETEIDMALLVENQQNIESDLVASLQFESPQACRWGSVQLEEAVIDSVEQGSRQLKVFAGMDYSARNRRMVVALLTVALAVAVVLMLRAHSWVFLARLGFSREHYPTETVIESIRISGRPVDSATLDSIHELMRLQDDILGAARKDLPGYDVDGIISQQEEIRSTLHELNSDNPPRDSQLPLERAEAAAANVVAMLTNAKQLAIPDRLTLRRATSEQLKVRENLEWAAQWPSMMRLGEGQPVSFVACCSGSIPEEGMVRLRSPSTGKRNPLSLDRGEEDDKGWVTFRGELPRLLEDITYKLYVGDAWTDASKISVIALPVVTPDFSVTPPEYAQAAVAPEQSESTGLRLRVLQSTRVNVEFVSANKSLKWAELTVKGEPKSVKYKLSSVGDDARRWALTAKGSPFDCVEQQIEYSVQVMDGDSLQLASPLEGTVGLRADTAPKVKVTRFKTKACKPSGKPVIEFRASDDYGLADLAVDVLIRRTSRESALGGRPEEAIMTKRLPVTNVLGPPKGRRPGTAERLGGDAIPRDSMPVNYPANRIEGGYRLDLGKLDLKIGDRLEVTLNATDYRGELKGKKSEIGSPLEIEISGESGVFTGVGVLDEESESRTSGLIDRQIRIGGSR